MSQHKNEAAIRKQVQWRQDSVATGFPGRDKNADNIRNTVATKNRKKCCRDIENWVVTQFEESVQK